MGEIYHHGLPQVNQYMQSIDFKFSTTQVPGYPIGLVSQYKYFAMCNCSNNYLWERDGQSIFRVIFDCGRTGYHSFR